MNREQLQSYIYTEKLLAQLYRQAAARATMQDERQVLLSFAQNAEQNANYLNYFYRQEFGTGFDPMIPEGNIQGTYRDLLNEIQKQELSSYLELRKLTYNQGDIELRETIRAITDDKLAHILTLLAIVTDMNTPESER
ncbi:hypothetical protein [Candidatus Stoquefichus sp. SB1]|jgi:hypothetical protein|uniref:hypothetical protein n=1 Tax=Candidatus Stoquefichus sp. SB1 TaxID=1658109 RepID=UPI00067EFA45|nr:hypothetical protein [Candidatus Stoquefichus sp. SB1]